MSLVAKFLRMGRSPFSKLVGVVGMTTVSGEALASGSNSLVAHWMKALRA